MIIEIFCLKKELKFNILSKQNTKINKINILISKSFEDASDEQHRET